MVSVYLNLLSAKSRQKFSEKKIILIIDVIIDVKSSYFSNSIKIHNVIMCITKIASIYANIIKRLITCTVYPENYFQTF